MRSRSFSTRAFLTAIALMCVVVFGVVTAQDRRNGAKIDIAGTEPGKEPFVQGELLVKFTDGGMSRFAESANQVMGSKVLENLADTGWQRVQLANGQDVKTAIGQYIKFQGVFKNVLFLRQNSMRLTKYFSREPRSRFWPSSV